MSDKDFKKVLEKPKSTVSDVIVKWKRRGSEAAEKRTSRPKILGERSRRTLKRIVKQNLKSSLVEKSQEFQSSSGISVSSRTVRREFKHLGSHGRAAAHKSNITLQNAKHRLQWCRAHRHWTLDMWKTVLWRDESRFTVWQLDGRAFGFGEHFFSDCIVPTVKFGGGSIMVWGCFSWFGLNPLVPVIGNMNSEMYVGILDNAALPTLWQYFGEGPFLFQRDNCSIHTSRLAQTWFDKMGVRKLDWPSQNPDLEHLGDESERRLRIQPNRPSSLQALTSAVMDAWKAIPMVTYQKLVENLPKRVQAVIHAKGGPTSY
ncbi:transposable element Tcb1 transposase [Trichonephila clavipes]|uniref:Transposable element Tcb1 transposase n=1 Tax=Trichonephila clavipes TaxID=2585209 RepID=A0A8X6RVS6_TRICX|nr:transposable element Tcb1 transposase [Trichonephila clavipes]